MKLFGAYSNSLIWFRGGSGQTFSVKGQMVSVLAFVGNLVSVVTSQLSHCCREACADNT